MSSYTTLPLTNSLAVLKVLQDKKLSLTDCYKQVPRLMFVKYETYVTLHDVNGIVGEAGGQIFEGGTGDDWAQVGLDEEHWFFGEADLDKPGMFRDNSGGQYLTRDNMIRIVKGHIDTIKKAKK